VLDIRFISLVYGYKRTYYITCFFYHRIIFLSNKMSECTIVPVRKCISVRITNANNWSCSFIYNCIEAVDIKINKCLIADAGPDTVC
jgi:hypothetical protein